MLIFLLTMSLLFRKKSRRKRQRQRLKNHRMLRKQKNLPMIIQNSLPRLIRQQAKISRADRKQRKKLLMTLSKPQARIRQKSLMKKNQSLSPSLWLQRRICKRKLRNINFRALIFSKPLSINLQKMCLTNLKIMPNFWLKLLLHSVFRQKLPIFQEVRRLQDTN